MNPVKGQAYRCADLPPGSVVRHVGPTGLVSGSEYVVGRSGCAMRWEQPIPGSEDWQVSYLYQLPPGEWMTDQEWKEVAGTGAEPEVTEGLFAHPDRWMDNEPGTLTLPPDWRQSSGNYKSGFRNYKAGLRRKATVRKHADFRQCPECGSPVNEYDMTCPTCGGEIGLGTTWPVVDHPHEPPLDSPQAPDTIPEGLDRPNLFGPMPQLPSNPDDSSSGLTIPEHFQHGDMTAPQDFAGFVRGYFDAALWTSSIGDEFAEAESERSRQAAESSDDPVRDLSADDSMTDAGFTEDDIDPTSRAAQTSECRNFVNDNSVDLNEYVEHLAFGDAEHAWAQAGRDFWFTRNGHGTGFWDRDPDEPGRRLTDAAKVYGESYAYVGDDGLVYFR